MENKEVVKKEKKELSKPVRYLLIGFGYLNLAIGVVAAFIPLLPSTPFLFLTVLSFAKGSAGLHKWFLSTKIYKNHLEGFVNKRAMTIKSKLSVIASLSIVMIFGFIMMRKIPIGQIVISVVWIGHLYYFIFKVKTDKKKPSVETDND